MYRSASKKFTARILENLEQRILLTADSLSHVDWFADVSSQGSGDSVASETDASDLSASNTQHGSEDERRWTIRINEQVAAALPSVAAAGELFQEDASFSVRRGLGLPGLFEITSPASDADLFRELGNYAFVEFAEPVAIARGQVAPDDTEFHLQHGLEQIDAETAWEVATETDANGTPGSLEVVVGVIDSGIDLAHPDLYRNIWINQNEIPASLMPPLPLDADVDARKPYRLRDVDGDGLISFVDLNYVDPESGQAINQGPNRVQRSADGNDYLDALDLLRPIASGGWEDGEDQDDNGFVDDLVGWDFANNDNDPSDDHRHGTHVAGTIAALGNNATATSGVAWETSLMPLKFLDSGNSGTTADAMLAVNYATMMKQRHDVAVRVTNNSFGIEAGFNQGLFDAIAASAEADILFVTAAGNGNLLGEGVDIDKSPFYPASYPLDNIVSVAALDVEGRLASFSNFGDETVDIAAPGVGIWSTKLGGRTTQLTASRNGTSMATPHVSGVAALVYARNPEASAFEVREALLAGAMTTNMELDDAVEGRRALNATGALQAKTFGPRATLAAVPLVDDANSMGQQITIRYFDSEGIDFRSFDDGDVVIRREGFSEEIPTTYVETVAASAEEVFVTYEIQPPHHPFNYDPATWLSIDNGEYEVIVQAGEVRDVTGIASGRLRLVGREGVADRISVDIPSESQVLFVTTRDDVSPDDLAEGEESLRSAIQKANESDSLTKIILPDGVYTFRRSDVDNADDGVDLDITGDVKIIGAGESHVVIDAQGLDRIFEVHAGATAFIAGATLLNGRADHGGAVRNDGELHLENVRVRNSIASQSGGGIYNTGVSTVNKSTLDGNRTENPLGAGGGAIANVGSLEVWRSTLSNNVSLGGALNLGGGGAIASQQADSSLLVSLSTLSGNSTASGSGGGIYASGPVDIVSSTIVNNSADTGLGGGIFAAAELGIRSSIVAQNRSVGGSDVDAVALGRLIRSGGGNLVGSLRTRLTGVGIFDRDQVGSLDEPLDAMLGPLRDNGGPTASHLPLPGSPALDLGFSDFSIANADQRGFERPNPLVSDGEGFLARDLSIDALADGLPDSGLQVPLQGQIQTFAITESSVFAITEPASGRGRLYELVESSNRVRLRAELPRGEYTVRELPSAVAISIRPEDDISDVTYVYVPESETFYSVGQSAEVEVIHATKLASALDPNTPLFFVNDETGFRVFGDFELLPGVEPRSLGYVGPANVLAERDGILIVQGTHEYNNVHRTGLHALTLATMESDYLGPEAPTSNLVSRSNDHVFVAASGDDLQLFSLNVETGTEAKATITTAIHAAERRVEVAGFGAGLAVTVCGDSNCEFFSLDATLATATQEANDLAAGGVVVGESYFAPKPNGEFTQLFRYDLPGLMGQPVDVGVLVEDLNGDSLLEHQGRLYFQSQPDACAHESEPTCTRFFEYEPTTRQTSLLTQFRSEDASMGVDPKVRNGKIYVQVDQDLLVFDARSRAFVGGMVDEGDSAAATNMSETGELLIEYPDLQGRLAGEFVRTDNGVLFAGFSEGGGTEPYFFDRRTSEITLVADLNPTVAGSDPRAFHIVDNNVVFVANDETLNGRLFVLDLITMDVQPTEITNVVWTGGGETQAYVLTGTDGPWTLSRLDPQQPGGMATQIATLDHADLANVGDAILYVAGNELTRLDGLDGASESIHTVGDETFVDFTTIGSSVYFRSTGGAAEQIFEYEDDSRSIRQITHNTDGATIELDGGSEGGLRARVGRLTAGGERPTPDRRVLIAPLLDAGAAERVAGEISGVVYVDLNRNGMRDPREVGLGGVPVYVDVNGNGRLDRGEPQTSSSEDNPFTPQNDEAGLYSFATVPPGLPTVKILLDPGFEQITPDFIDVEAQTAAENVTEFQSVSTEGSFGLDGGVSVGDGKAAVVAYNRNANGGRIPDSLVIMDLQTGESTNFDDQGSGFVFYDSPILADGEMAFWARSVGEGGQIIRGIYIVGRQGEISRVVDSTQSIPGRDEDFESFNLLGFADGLVLFRGADTGDRFGLYVGNANGDIRLLADRITDVVADNEVVRLTQFGSASIDDTVYAFSGLHDDGRAAVYRAGGAPGEFVSVANQSTEIPDGEGTFTKFVEVAISGSRIVFNGRGLPTTVAGQATRQEGIYIAEDERLDVVANSATLIPDGVGTFSSFGKVAADDRNVVFHGFGTELEQEVSLSIDGDGQIILQSGGTRLTAVTIESSSGSLSLDELSGPFDVVMESSPHRISLGSTTGFVNLTGMLELPISTDGHHDALSISYAVENGFESLRQLFPNQGTRNISADDLDNDGDLDLFVTVNLEPSQVWLNDGTGSFIDSGQRLVAENALWADLGDVDGDGDVDAVVANPTGANSLWLNQGDGTFDPQPVMLDSDQSIDAELGDVDGDGDLDIFFTRAVGITNAALPDHVLLNDGVGNFVNSGQALGNLKSGGVEFGDFDADGDLDAVVSARLNPDRTHKIWINDGTGTFTDSGQDLPTGSFDVQPGDLDGDGDLDLIGSRGGDNDIYLNDGMGNFTQDEGRSFGSASSGHVGLLDFDGDGDLDVFSTGWRGNPNTLWLNDGDANFSDAGQYLDLPEASSRMATGDIDGDGDEDVIVMTETPDADSILVYRNQYDAGLSTRTFGPFASQEQPYSQEGIYLAVEDQLIKVVDRNPLDQPEVFGGRVPVSFSIANDSLNGNQLAIRVTFTDQTQGAFVAEFVQRDSHIVTLQPATELRHVNFGVVALPGSISGTRFEDANGNAIRETGEATLAGWTIYIDENDNGLLDANEIRTETDEDGNYRLNNLPGRTSYILRSEQREDWNETLPTPGAEGRHVVFLNASEDRPNVDFGGIRDTSSDGATVTGTISGRLVFDGANDPGALLGGRTVFIDTNEDQFPDGEPQTTTLPDGTFEFLDVPIGSWPIRVVVDNDLPQLSPQQNTFSIRTLRNIGDRPAAVIAADINNDGLDDLISANNVQNDVTILTNDGDGGYVRSQATVGSGPVSMVEGDFNLDGNIDIAVANSHSGTVSILQGDGDGGFALTTVDAGMRPAFIATADYDNDGRPDLFVVNQGSDDISILRNATTEGSVAIQFVTEATPGVGADSQPSSVAIADVDKDDDLDLIVAIKGGGDGQDTAVVLLNEGASVFALQPNSIPVGNRPEWIIAAQLNDDDMNGTIDSDDHVDIVTANANQKTISIRYGQGDGTFTFDALRDEVSTGVGTRSLLAHDVDNDGDQDLVVAVFDPDTQFGTASIVRNNGDGTFQPAAILGAGDFAPSSVAYSLTVANINGDGTPDLVVADGIFNSISLLTNFASPGAHQVVISGAVDVQNLQFAFRPPEQPDRQPGDFDDSGQLGINDLDLLYAAIAGGDNVDEFDVTEDQQLDASDVEAWMALFDAPMGDADLNGVVEFVDFLEVSKNFGQEVDSWSDGDFDANGVVDFPDFLTLSGNFGQSN